MIWKTSCSEWLAYDFYDAHTDPNHRDEIHTNLPKRRAFVGIEKDHKGFSPKTSNWIHDCPIWDLHKQGNRNNTPHQPGT